MGCQLPARTGRCRALASSARFLYECRGDGDVLSVYCVTAAICTSAICVESSVNQPAPDLCVHGVTKRFEGTAGAIDVLTGAELSLSRGEVAVVTGPSGSGKSTLLYIIGLLDTPTSGEVQIAGKDVLTLDATQQAEFRNRNIGFVFQDHHLLPQCTVLENVLLPSIAGEGAGAVEAERAQQLLGRVGLADRVQHRPAQLSGGERQRVAVCRALINAPLLLLADEPTGNLDQKTAESVGSLLLEIAVEQNTMLVCVTHSLELARRFDQRYELSEGQLVRQ
ncbi:MAG: ABC transporter ATP-binding protein [Planctomycetota bacterium]|nr:MAG: ABC transporter ATP-binding protein [Planctomycetota bacterium]